MSNCAKLYKSLLLFSAYNQTLPSSTTFNFEYWFGNSIPLISSPLGEYTFSFWSGYDNIYINPCQISQSDKSIYSPGPRPVLDILLINRPSKTVLRDLSITNNVSCDIITLSTFSIRLFSDESRHIYLLSPQTNSSIDDISFMSTLIISKSPTGSPVLEQDSIMKHKNNKTDLFILKI